MAGCRARGMLVQMKVLVAGSEQARCDSGRSPKRSAVSSKAGTGRRGEGHRRRAKTSVDYDALCPRERRVRRPVARLGAALRRGERGRALCRPDMAVLERAARRPAEARRGACGQRRTRSSRRLLLAITVSSQASSTRAGSVSESARSCSPSGQPTATTATGTRSAAWAKGDRGRASRARRTAEARLSVRQRRRDPERDWSWWSARHTRARRGRERRRRRYLRSLRRQGRSA